MDAFKRGILYITVFMNFLLRRVDRAGFLKGECVGPALCITDVGGHSWRSLEAKKGSRNILNNRPPINPFQSHLPFVKTQHRGR